jgi:GT2 family glycosyltransferase
VTYNRKREVLEALSSLKNQTYKKYEVILVDNASTDGTVKEVTKQFPKVKFVLNKTNRMAIARNDGIAPSRGKYILFADSDNIFDPNMIKELVILAESDSTIGFVGPKMYFYNAPNTIWYAGADINLLTSKTTYIGINEIDKGQHDQIRPVGHIPNIFLVNRQVITEIGGFDESYIMSYTESDFPMRAKKKGYKILFCPTAKAWHKIPLPGKTTNPVRGLGFESPIRAYYFARNRAILMKKHTSKLNFYFFLLLFYPIFGLYFILQTIKFMRIDILKGYLSGMFNGYFYALFEIPSLINKSVVK